MRPPSIRGLESSIPRRIALSMEIVRTYIRVRWLLWRSENIMEVVASLRDGLDQPVGHDVSVRLGRRLVRPIRRTLDPLPGDSRCLMRALVLVAMLRARNVYATVVIGVATEGGFSAHAWVQHDEVQLLPAAGHEPLATI